MVFCRLRFTLVALSLGAWQFFGPPATAQTLGAQSLAQSSNCMACHQADRKVVGPAFSTIAERFKGNGAAADYLVQSIKNGSKGRWGPVPMPRQVHVSEKDARELAEWILSLVGDEPVID